jgi:hypothetical protein
VKTDAALHPNGCFDLGEHALQKDERRLVAHDAACLVPLHDQRVGSPGERRASLVDRRHLRENGAVAPRESPGGGWHHDDAHFRWKYDRSRVDVLRDAHPERTSCATREGHERVVDRRWIMTGVEHAERAGSDDRRHERHVRALEGG